MRLGAPRLFSLRFVQRGCCWPCFALYSCRRRPHWLGREATNVSRERREAAPSCRPWTVQAVQGRRTREPPSLNRCTLRRSLPTTPSTKQSNKVKNQSTAKAPVITRPCPGLAPPPRKYKQCSHPRANATSAIPSATAPDNRARVLALPLRGILLHHAPAISWPSTGVWLVARVLLQSPFGLLGRDGGREERAVRSPSPSAVKLVDLGTGDDAGGEVSRSSRKWNAV